MEEQIPRFVAYDRGKAHHTKHSGFHMYISDDEESKLELSKEYYKDPEKGYLIG